MQTTYLHYETNLWLTYPEARRRQHPGLVDKHGIIFEVFDVDYETDYMLIVDFRYLTGRPDSIRFLQNPWTTHKAFSVASAWPSDDDAGKYAVEIIHCETVDEREQVFSDLISRLATLADEGPDFGSSYWGNDNPLAPVPVRPLPAGLVGGSAQEAPKRSPEDSDESGQSSD